MATPLPNSSVLRVSPEAVTPLQPDVKISPDGKGSGSYTAQPQQTSAPASNPSAPLNILIPSSLTSNAASLSASAMFAAQALAQDTGSSALLATYEAFAQAAAVKYMPSNATKPEPAPNNLFARMLAETKGQPAPQKIDVPVQQVAKEAALQPAAQVQAQVQAPAPKQSSNVKNKTQAPIAAVKQASTAYQSTAIRNDRLLDEELKVEPIVG